MENSISFVPSSTSELFKLSQDVINYLQQLKQNHLEMFENDQELEEEYAYIHEHIKAALAELSAGNDFNNQEQIKLRHVFKDYLRLEMCVLDPIIN